MGCECKFNLGFQSHSTLSIETLLNELLLRTNPICSNLSHSVNIGNLLLQLFAVAGRFPSIGVSFEPRNIVRPVQGIVGVMDWMGLSHESSTRN